MKTCQKLRFLDPPHFVQVIKLPVDIFQTRLGPRKWNERAEIQTNYSTPTLPSLDCLRACKICCIFLIMPWGENGNSLPANSSATIPIRVYRLCSRLFSWLMQWSLQAVHPKSECTVQFPCRKRTFSSGWKSRKPALHENPISAACLPDSSFPVYFPGTPNQIWLGWVGETHSESSVGETATLSSFILVPVNLLDTLFP